MAVVSSSCEQPHTVEHPTSTMGGATAGWPSGALSASMQLMNYPNISPSIDLQSILRSCEERRLLEERLRTEQCRNAQLTSTLEEQDAALLQMQSALAVGGRFVAVESPGSVEESDDKRREEIRTAVQEARRRAAKERQACIEQVKKEMDDLCAREVHRAVAECNATRDAEISRLKEQHRTDLFNQKMAFKREMLRIVPEMAHNLNKWHFGLVKRINDLLPTDSPGEDRSYDTPSFGGGSGGAAARNAQPALQEMRPPTHPPTKEEAELRYLGETGPKGRASVRKAAVKPANVEVGGKGA